MDPLSLVLIAIRGLSVVTNNPALGGGSSVRMQEASGILSMLGELVERGDEALEELAAFAQVIEKMAAEGRSPNRAEWDVLRARSDTAHSVLQDAKADLEADSEPDPDPDPE